MKKKPVNYINNERLHAEIVDYIQAYYKAQENNEPLPQISNYIGRAIQKIGQGLASRPNFSGYTYIEDMISDGVEDCCKYLHNYNYVKYNKPFTYINRIMWQAFVRRISREKKQQILKYKSATQNNDIIMDPNLSRDIYEKIYEYEKSKDELK